MALFLLVVALLLLAAMADGRPRTARTARTGGGCGPKASHSAPPRADYTPAKHLLCGDCGFVRTVRECECCDALARGTACLPAVC